MRHGILLALCALAPSVSGQNLWKGSVQDENGTALPGVEVAFVRAPTIAGLDGDERVDPALFDLSVTTDARGAFDALLDETWTSFYLFTVSVGHLNQVAQAMNASPQSCGRAAPVEGTYAFPLVDQLLRTRPLCNLRAADTVRFSLRSNRVPLMIGMQDGALLSTDVYFARSSESPFTSTPDPLVLLRTPYNKDGPSSQQLLQVYRFLSLYGYTVVVQNIRGVGASTGEKAIFGTDGWADQFAPPPEGLADGATTVDWLVTSSDDRLHDAPIGTIGDSGLSLTQYLLAGTLHPNVKACFTRMSPPSVYEFLFDDGIYRREAMDRWLGLQLGDSGRDAYLEENAISHPDRTDGWWDPIDVFATHPILGQPLSSLIDVPTYFVSGHFDLFRRKQVRLFEALRSNGTASASHQLLRVGPWSHTNSTGALGSLDGRTLPGFPGHAVSIAADAFVFEALHFFDNWVRGPPSAAYDPPRVVYFRMGDTTTSGPWNEWVLADDFPTHDARELLLLADGVLSPEELTPRLPLAPVGRAYVSDPSCPVPTKGGDTLFSSTIVADCLQPSLREPIGDGPWDQDDPTLPLGSRIDRSDVLSWTGEVLGTPLEVTGTVSAHLAFSSDAPDIDLVVKLMDVRPDGRSLLIVEGAGSARYRNGLDQPTCLSRNPNEIATIDIDLGFTSYVFDAGHRLRVAVSSSDHPRLEVNPQNGCSFRSSGGPHDCPGGCTSQAPFVATNQIWCFEGSESSITLPVVQ